MSKVNKKYKKVRKKSNCWLFYTKTEKGGACRLCQKEIISNGNTTNLLNHLKRKHTVQWESAVEITEDITRFDSDSNEEEEDEDSNELHRSPKETQQAQGLAYQSADGRTVIWLHPDVQVEQLSAAGYQPQITLVGQSSEDGNEQETPTLVSGEQTEGENILGIAEVTQKGDDTGQGSEDIQNADDANSEGGLHISETFVVASEEVCENVVVTSSGEVMPQIVTVVSTSEELFTKKAAITSTPKVSLVNSAPSMITVSSPQKVMVTHSASSHKSSKKVRPKKRCKHSSDNDVIIQNKPYKKVHVNSHVEESVCAAQGSSRSYGEVPREDSFDHFGKYMATLLRNLPSRRSACRLQKEMINWVLKEQMLFED